MKVVDGQAAAGLGKLGLADADTVALNNLHRQVIHDEASVGQPKVFSGQRACRALNSSLEVEVHPEGGTPENALALVSQYDVVVDASDNAPTRYLLNDACVVNLKSATTLTSCFFLCSVSERLHTLRV